LFGAECLRAFLKGEETPMADAGGVLISRFLAQNISWEELSG